MAKEYYIKEYKIKAIISTWSQGHEFEKGNSKTLKINGKTKCSYYLKIKKGEAFEFLTE